MGSRDDVKTAFEELLARPRAPAGDAGAPSVVAPSGAGAGSVEGAVRVALGGILWHAFGRPGLAGPSWWLGAGVELELADQQLWFPDLIGFRRRRGEPIPTGRPIRQRPDWVCEIVVGAISAPDAVAQQRHPRRVPHLWIADVGQQSLHVYRWTASGYEVVTTADAGTSVRAAPFDGIPIRLDEIFAG